MMNPLRILQMGLSLSMEKQTLMIMLSQVMAQTYKQNQVLLKHWQLLIMVQSLFVPAIVR